ncbi:histidinol dehydrogenase, partial [Patescibacteria group bacterium]|nr:histidinol dehydrogenase [Patescibacteria group bacterium]
QKIINNVRKKGDKEILSKYQTRFGKVNYQSVEVTDIERNKAYEDVDPTFIKALKQMIKNITAVHCAQLKNKVDTTVTPESGIRVWREWRPVEKVGLYIPGGKAVYPSSVLMSVIPAKIAGCKEIAVCSPPDQNGKIPSPTVVAADMVGVKKIFRIGGAEAIAAMAYGTKSIPKVYKIFGAGNSFVTAAKILVSQDIAIDMPAGPSEIFIIADESANPVYIAADLLADGEHGEDSACVLLTTSWQIAKGTKKELEKQLERLPTGNRAEESLKRYGLIGVAESMSDVIEFTNEYAPEHLEIMTGNPEGVADKIINAGSVFLGNWTTKSSGDYATGANHVLPTGGMAKMYPPLGVEAYGKWMQLQECTKEGLANIKETIETVATIEKLPAHKYSTSIRFT